MREIRKKRFSHSNSLSKHYLYQKTHCILVISKHGCQPIERESDLEKKAWKRERHDGKCKNYKGSSTSMETEGVKNIFERSKSERNLQYTEYFGDGDSKAYASPYGS